MGRQRIQLTDTHCRNLDRHLLAQGRPLDRPQEVRDAQIIGLALRRQPSGSKLWFYCFTHAGRRSRIAIGRFPELSVERARSAAKLRAAEIAHGSNPVAKKREAAAKVRAEIETRTRADAEKLGTFLTERFEPWALEHLRSAKPMLRALRTDFRAWLDQSMSTIGSFQFERWRTAERKRGIKANTLNRALERLLSVLHKAAAWGVIAPADVPRIKKLKVEEKRVRYLSDAERTRLYAAMEARETAHREARERLRQHQIARGRKPLLPLQRFADHLQPLVRLLLGTGLRRGECLQLTWGDVDWKRGQVMVRGETAKDSEARFVPMTADALEAVTEWRDQQKPAALAADRFIFPHASGERIKSVKKAWAALMERAKLDNFKLHDLRHDFASRLVAAGVPLYDVAKLLGHATTQMTERYAHLSPDHLRAALDKLNAVAVKGAA